MWAFSDPAVSSEDLVVTSDANAFVAGPSTLDPLYNNPGRLVWAFQVDPSDGNFAMTFVAAWADVWKTITSPGILLQST